MTHAGSMTFTLCILTMQLFADMNNIFKLDVWNLFDILEDDEILI